MKFKTFKNLNLIKKYKQKELQLKSSRFLFIYLLNILQYRQNKEYSPLEIKNIKRQYLFLRAISLRISKTMLFRNCILTGRSRSVYRPYGLSRCALKNLIQFGKLPGFKKSIW